MKSLSKIEKISIVCFLFWLTAGILFTPLRLTPDQVSEWNLPRFLLSFISFCLSWGDSILIFLAAFNTWLLSCRYWTKAEAILWLLEIFLISATLEIIGALTGFPFGVYTYTTKLGLLIGEILPLAVPCAWYTVTTQFLFFFRSFSFAKNIFIQAIMTALAATLFDGILEPFATTIRGYWQWRGFQIPWQNYLAWWLTVFFLILFLAPRKKVQIKDSRPCIIMGGMLFLFIEARCLYHV